MGLFRDIAVEIRIKCLHLMAERSTPETDIVLNPLGA